MPSVSVKSLASFTQAVPAAIIGADTAKDSLVPRLVSDLPTAAQSVETLLDCVFEALPTFSISLTAWLPSACILTFRVAKSKLAIFTTSHSLKLSYSLYIYFSGI